MELPFPVLKILKEISINAKEKIDMRCKSSKIIMDGDIEIYGEDVRIN